MTADAQAKTSRILDRDATIPLENGKTFNGVLEYFPAAHSLAIFGEQNGQNLDLVTLTVNASEAPEAHAALKDDEVLVRNWTTHRGIATALVDQGRITLGDPVEIGMFKLQAFVARVH